MPKGYKINYSDQELKWLKDNCTLVSKDYHAGFMKLFNRDDVTEDNLKTLRVRRGWRTGRTGKFYKGQPRIKGSGCKTANSGSFKKGMIPDNARPLLSERVCKDGYTWIKMREKNDGNHRNCFDLKHTVLWEKHNGKVPQGHAVLFLDGDKTNITLDNLICVPRSALGRLNSRYRDIKGTGEYRRAAIAMSMIDEKTQQTKTN